MYVLLKKPVTDPLAAPVARNRKVVVAEIGLENTNAGSRLVSIHTFSARDRQGHTYAPSSATSTHLHKELAGGESVTGYLAFEVPPEATVDRIVWSWPVFEWVNQWTWQ